VHGMINRGLQCYIRDIHGVDVWEETCEQAKLPYYNFESMLTYDDATTEDLLSSFGSLVGRQRDEILEDFGVYIVSEDALSTVRRLLKFGGTNYVEFLKSLDFVYDRAKLAVPDLDIPMMELVAHGPCRFTLYARFQKRGYGVALLGLLRALADDYNALISIVHSRNKLKHVDEDIFAIELHNSECLVPPSPDLVQH
jgi:GNAT superfamily N-acetyltransferase